MFVVTWAKSGKLLRDARAIRKETGRLQNGTEFTADATDSARHAKLAHVRLHTLYILVCKEILNLGHMPTCGEPWMLMEEESSVLSLMFIDLSAEPDISSLAPFRVGNSPSRQHCSCT